MTEKNDTKKLDALIFIDTNIFLDFYRIRRSNVSIKYLEEIKSNLNLIITSSQVEMEFKKNRQNAIIESIAEVKKINNININVPAILSDENTNDKMKKFKKEIEEQHKYLKQKTESIFKEPNKNDSVYEVLGKLFLNKSSINLNRDNPQRFTIRRLAMKRFMLGYPPRKKSDNSIGDAINWEWIIKCAIDTGKHIILVTRDTDFGEIYEDESYLNDWLFQEFKERVDPNRELVLTDKLSHAFKLVKINVTEEMIKEEEDIIKNISFTNNYKDVFNSFQNNPVIIDMKKMQENAQESLRNNPIYNSLYELNNLLNNYNKIKK